MNKKIMNSKVMLPILTVIIVGSLGTAAKAIDFKKWGRDIKGAAEKVKTGFEKHIIDPIKEKVIKPAAQALDPKKLQETMGNAAKDALKAAGINIDAMMKDVSGIRTKANQIQREANGLKQNINAPNGPIVKGKQAGQQMAQLQQSINSLKKKVDLNKLKQALFDPTVKLSAEVEQEFSRALKLFDDVLETAFSITLRPSLGNLIKITDNARLIMSLIGQAHRNSGKVGDILVPRGLMQSIRVVEGDLKNINGDLRQLHKDGTTEEKTIKNQLADAILFKSSAIIKTSQSIKSSMDGIKSEANKLSQRANAIGANTSSLIAEVIKMRGVSGAMRSNIEKHLKSKPFEFFKAPNIARDTLNAQLAKIRGELSKMLQTVSGCFSIISTIVNLADNFLDSIKKDLGIAILTPGSDKAMAELTKHLKELSNHINTLNRELGNALKGV